MTVLSVFQSACRRLLAQEPQTLFSTTGEALQIKMKELIAEAALDIAKSHDWRDLTRLCKLPTDGSTGSFALPDDYDRMPVKADVHSNVWSRVYQPASDMDDWIQLTQFMPATIPGYWRIFSGQMHIIPSPASGDSVSFGYISAEIAKDTNGKGQSGFLADSDVFALDERLLLLSVIWRWKAAEGLDYQEDMANYERYLAQLTAKDGGSNPIRSSRSNVSRMGIWGLAR
ncbi:MAG: hypothetical protein ABF968_04825 [Acetobacter sp.]|uniref:phage adaptor protein n=1 Tax=Acetobacter sp. TaxID=440 RepID=UPI0039EA9675